MKEGKQLKNLATIHSGYSLRGPAIKTITPNVVWVQPSNIMSQDFNNLQHISVKLAKNITVLQSGDVLLTNRVNFKAALAPVNNIATLASIGIFIIRPNKNYLNSGFLTFWLNSLEGQRALQGLSNEFTTIKSIRKEDLENLNIPLPSLEEQEKLANLYSCYIKQKYLQTQRLNLQEKLLNAISAGI